MINVLDSIIYHFSVVIQTFLYIISEAIVVVLESVKSEVQNVLEQNGPYKLSMKLDFVGIPSSEDWGTADSLRFLYESNKIKVP